MKVESLVDSGIDYIVNENYALERRPNGFCLNFYISLFAVNNKIVVFTDIKKMEGFFEKINKEIYTNKYKLLIKDKSQIQPFIINQLDMLEKHLIEQELNYNKEVLNQCKNNNYADGIQLIMDNFNYCIAIANGI